MKVLMIMVALESEGGEIGGIYIGGDLNSRDRCERKCDKEKRKETDAHWKTVK